MRALVHFNATITILLILIFSLILAGGHTAWLALGAIAGLSVFFGVVDFSSSVEKAERWTMDMCMSGLFYLVAPAMAHDMIVYWSTVPPQRDRSPAVRITIGFNWPLLAFVPIFIATGSWWSLIAPVLLLLIQYIVANSAPDIAPVCTSAHPT